MGRCVCCQQDAATDSSFCKHCYSGCLYYASDPDRPGEKMGSRACTKGVPDDEFEKYRRSLLGTKRCEACGGTGEVTNDV